MTDSMTQTPTPTIRPGFRRPSASLLAMESVRSMSEASATRAMLPVLRSAVRGDGHPVVVLPGFTANDRSTQLLRWLLGQWGFDAQGWGLGVNLGPTDHILDGLDSCVARVGRSHPGRRLTLIGWSLGGIYARLVARANPESVRQVISLGSPLKITAPNQSNAGHLYRGLAPLHSHRADEWMAPRREPLTGVPATAIYTRTDGVVAWEACVEDPGPQHECVEVDGSHAGLGHNAAALLVIADRLTQPEGEWRPFEPPPHLRFLYPSLRSPRPAPAA